MPEIIEAKSGQIGSAKHTLEHVTDMTLLVEFSLGLPCENSLLSGHVIAGTKAKTVAKASNSVRIYPICVQQNNDDNVYMEALMYLNGIWLKNYLSS